MPTQIKGATLVSSVTRSFVPLPTTLPGPSIGPWTDAYGGLLFCYVVCMIFYGLSNLHICPLIVTLLAVKRGSATR